jgi:hypothetical protein
MASETYDDDFGQVIDFSLKGGVNAETVFKTALSPPATPKSIPEQKPETLRVCFVQGMFQSKRFPRPVQELIPDSWYGLNPSPSFSAALSQCQSDSQENGWWAINLISCGVLYNDSSENESFDPYSIFPINRFLGTIVYSQIRARFFRDPDNHMICKETCAALRTLS